VQGRLLIGPQVSNAHMGQKWMRYNRFVRLFGVTVFFGFN